MNGIIQQPESSTWLSILPFIEEYQTFQQSRILTLHQITLKHTHQIYINHYKDLKYHRKFRNVK